MRKILILTLFLSATIQGFSQQGIGIRLGDPSGISYKRYNGDNALEFSIGRTHLVGKGYYNNKFDKWYSDAAFKYDNYRLVESNISIPIGIQAHYLIHEDWYAHEFDGLQWYYGFGAQLRFQSYSHEYQYKISGDPNWYSAETEKFSDIDLGVDGVIGAEYEFPEHPFRVYADFTLFLEVVDDPFKFWGQVGIGGRYMF